MIGGIISDMMESDVLRLEWEESGTTCVELPGFGVLASDGVKPARATLKREGIE
jgi:hypothetical protein